MNENDAMRIPLLHGRSFSASDGPSTAAVAVVNMTMARQFWPNQNPIGKRFRYGSPGAIEPKWLTIIGLVGDMNPYGSGSKVISTFYLPWRQVFSGAALCPAAIGIYGLLSYLVLLRIQEIGIRIALGATASDVLRMVLVSGMKLAGGGIILGLGVSFFLMRLPRYLKSAQATRLLY